MGRAGTIASRMATARDEANEFIEALSRDEGIDVDAAARVCTILGKPLSWLEAEAKRIRDDRVLRENLLVEANSTEFEALKDERTKVTAELESARAEYVEIGKRVNERSQRLQQLIPLINNALHRRDKARRDLHNMGITIE